MAKIQIKSEKLTPFGGIFSIMEQFDSTLLSVIDSTLGLRCRSFGYQYSEIISPLSLHARWSLKPWHQPIVPFPSVAIPLNTLLAYLLRLWHTGIIVESTNVMPVHLPKAPRLRKNMSWKNTRLSNSTKRLYDTAFGKYDFIVPLMKNR